MARTRWSKRRQTLPPVVESTPREEIVTEPEEIVTEPEEIVTETTPIVQSVIEENIINVEINVEEEHCGEETFEVMVEALDEEDDFEVIVEPVEGDDCEAFVDDDVDNGENDINIEDEVREEEGNVVEEQEEVREGEDNDVEEEVHGDFEEEEVNGVGLDEEECGNMAAHFGDAAMDNEENDDEGDDIWNDDVIPDPLDPEDDEEEYERRQEAANDQSRDELLYLGKTFNCASDFKVALLRYSLKTAYDIKMYKSSSDKLGAMCSDEDDDCQWKVYCSYVKSKHKLQVKIFNSEHSCMRSGYSKLLKTSSIALLYSERLRINPKFTKTEMAEDIKRAYNLIVSEDQCAKAKTKLYRERKASHDNHFARLWDYQAEIWKSNPGTTMVIDTIPGATPQSKQRFDRLYVCFKAQRESWKKTCRPIIGLDGAFLKWDIKGHLLAAVGRDGNNMIVPIAWAVVEIENNITWDWFVKCLQEDLNLGDGKNITIISDKQKGLVNAVANDLPQAEHRMCARHILANWRRESDVELEHWFWKIARSYTRAEYENHMESLKVYNRGAYDSLLLSNPPTWSRAFFKVGSCCNDNLNNLCESFNKTIREARKKPLLDMLEDIRRQTMVRNVKRSLCATNRKTKFTKRVHDEIEATKVKAKDCRRYMATGDLHEVIHLGVGYRVDMSRRTCGCGRWQLNGIPCIHATCVILAKKQKVRDFVSPYYTTKKWRETYLHGIKPVQGMPLWPKTYRLPVLPPPYRKGNRGRPSNYARRKGQNEATSSSTTVLTGQKRTMTCSKCKQQGHNKKGCINAPVEPQPKRPRGRPRKEGPSSEQGYECLSQTGPSQGSTLGQWF